MGVSSACRLNSLHLQLLKSETTIWGFGGCWSRGKKVTGIISLSSVFWGWQGMTAWGRMKGHIGNPLVTISGTDEHYGRGMTDSSKWWGVPAALVNPMTSDLPVFFPKMRWLTWKNLLRNGAVTTPKAQYNLLLPDNLLGKECGLRMWFRNVFYRTCLK